MLLLAFVLLNIIYIVFFFTASIRLNAAAPHYFLGFGPTLFFFQIGEIKFSVGFYIPVIGLAKIYTVVNGEKHPMMYPWEFFDQPLGRRWMVTLSGAIGLFLTGTIIFIGITYFNEERIIAKEEVNRNGIYPSKLALKYGFQQGDKIVAFNGKDYTHFYELVDPEVITHPDTYYTILRDNKKMDIPTHVSADSLDRSEYFFSLLAPFVVEQVMENTPAEKAGLLAGDRIVKVNDHSIVKYHELNEALLSDDDDNVTLTVKRGKGTNSNTFNVEVVLDGNRTLGIIPKELINYTTKENSFSESIVKGTYSALYVPVIQIRAFGKMFTGTLSVKKSLSGPVRINSSLNTYLRLFAILAIVTTLFNLLPFPKSALWEMIPLTYEGITGKRFSTKLFPALRKIAIFILVLLIVVVFISDLINLL